MTELQPCGTYAGYQTHKRQDTAPCDACKKAQADYQKRYRREHPQYQDSSRARSKAYSRALRKLAMLYPAEFERLYAAEERRP